MRIWSLNCHRLIAIAPRLYSTLPQLLVCQWRHSTSPTAKLLVSLSMLGVSPVSENTNTQRHVLGIYFFACDLDRTNVTFLFMIATGRVEGRLHIASCYLWNTYYKKRVRICLSLARRRISTGCLFTRPLDQPKRKATEASLERCVSEQWLLYVSRCVIVARRSHSWRCVWLGEGWKWRPQIFISIIVTKSASFWIVCKES